MPDNDPKSGTDARDESADAGGIWTTLGVPGLKAYGGHVDEEWHPKLRGRQGARKYREMLDNDPLVGAFRLAITSLIQSALWPVKPPSDTPTQEQQDWADFVTDCYGDMDHTFDDLLDDLLSALFYGWAYCEIVYQLRDGGAIGLRKVELRGQDTLDRWEFGPHGEILGMHQRVNSTTAYIPAAKAVHFRTTRQKNNPEGRSLLRNGFRSYRYATRLEEIEAIGIERELCGLPIAEVPPEMLTSNDSTHLAAVANLKRLVQGIRANTLGGAVVPSPKNSKGDDTGYAFKVMTSGGRRSIDPGAAIERHQSRLAISLLSQFLLLGQSTQVGSFALAETGTALLAVAAGAIMERIASTITKELIHPLCLLNGARREDLPRQAHGDLDQPALAQFASFLDTMIRNKVITVDDKIEEKAREVGGLPPRQATTDPDPRPQPDTADDTDTDTEERSGRSIDEIIAEGKPLPHKENRE